MSEVQIQADTKRFAYDGNVKKPQVTLIYGDETLVEDEDYVLEYPISSISPGSYSLMITGQGIYCDELKVEYEIIGIPIDGIALDATSLAYDGTARRPGVTVRCGDRVLSEGADYEVSCPEAVSVGSYELSVTGRGNYSGTLTAGFEVAPAAITAVALDATSLAYDGTARRPGVTVRCGDRVLSEGADYEVSCPEAVSVGSYELSVTGRGNYSGTLTAGFEIVSEAIASGAWGTCFWEIAPGGTITIHPGTGANTDAGVPWSEHASSIKKIVFSSEAGAKVIAPEIASALMAGLENLQEVDFSGLDTSNVADMSRMFQNCASLTSLDLSSLDTSSVMNMGGIFDSCSSLVTINLSGLSTSQVTNMAAMFWGCSSLISLNLSGFDTSQVTRMPNMFGGCSSLRSIDLSGFKTSRVTDMLNMFSGCSSLTSLDVSNLDTSQVTVMLGMFGGCSSLTKINLSNFDTTRVVNAESMLDGCTSLSEIALGKNCKGGFIVLPSYKVNGHADWYSTKAGAWMEASDIQHNRVGIEDTYTKTQPAVETQRITYSISGTTLIIRGRGEMKRSDLDSITYSRKKEIKTIVFEEGITGIEDSPSNLVGIFEYYSNVETIKLPSTFTKIGNYAFKGCHKLTSFDFGQSSATLGDYVFEDCRALTNITFGPNVKNIGRHTFSKCPNLASVDLGNGIQEIGDYAFSNMLGEYPALTTVRIGLGVKRIGKNAFCDCRKLASVTFGTNIEEIGESAFTGCSSLANVKLGDNVEIIGKQAFSDCSSLTSFDRGKSSADIGESAFSGCSSLAVVKLGSGGGKVGPKAFDSCTNLSDVDFGQKPVEIGERAFRGCVSLKTANMPKVALIGDGAFSGCSALKSVTVNSVQSIGKEAFAQCSSLKYIKLPASLNSIGSSAFTSLAEGSQVEFAGDVPKLNGTAVESPSTTIYSANNASWTKKARKNIASDANNMAIRNADGSLTKAPILCVFQTIEVPFGSAKSDFIETDALKSNRCFDFTVPKDGKTRISMSYMLPCYHGSYFITLLDSTGKEIYSDICMRHPNANELLYNGRYVIEPELKAGDYHLEVIYVQSHKGNDGMFTVGVYNIAPTPTSKPDPTPTPDPDPAPNPDPDPTPAPEPQPDPEPVATNAMYRLYNPNSGEHFYSSSTVERDHLVSLGWQDEGTGWIAPASGDAVYRLYNPYAGEHHYTLSAAERDMLVSVGWNDEGIGWYSDPNESVPLFRVYNPNEYANNHHYTTSAAERDMLLSIGWQDEGVSWHGVG